MANVGPSKGSPSGEFPPLRASEASEASRVVGSPSFSNLRHRGPPRAAPRAASTSRGSTPQHTRRLTSTESTMVDQVSHGMPIPPWRLASPNHFGGTFPIMDGNASSSGSPNNSNTQPLSVGSLASMQQNVSNAFPPPGGMGRSPTPSVRSAGLGGLERDVSSYTGMGHRPSSVSTSVSRVRAQAFGSQPDDATGDARRTSTEGSGEAPAPPSFSFTVFEAVRSPPPLSASTNAAADAASAGGRHLHLPGTAVNIWGHEGAVLKRLFGGGKKKEGCSKGGATDTASFSNSLGTDPRGIGKQPSLVMAGRSGTTSIPPPPSAVGAHGSSPLDGTDPYSRDYSETSAKSSGDTGHASPPLIGPTFRTRNMNALQAFPWDRRAYLPTGRGPCPWLFRLFASPRFFEKVDWAVRGALLTIIPTLALCLEPATRSMFPLPTSVVALAYWISQPTFGSGLCELFQMLKGFSLSLVVLCIILAIHPGPKWLSLILMFIALVSVAFAAERARRICAFVLCAQMMQYIANPDKTNLRFVADYFLTLLIAQGFGAIGFFVPYIRWSSDVARHYIAVMGDSLSLLMRGMCLSFWVASPLERQFLLTRMRQLRATVEESMTYASRGITETGYEPHTGKYVQQLKSRYDFLSGIFNIAQSMGLLIEQLAHNPTAVDTPLCREFGKRIKAHITQIASAIDHALLRIADLEEIITEDDLAAFKEASDRFAAAVASAREEVILNNEDYQTGDSDVLLGFFLFCTEELCTTIASFKDEESPRSNIRYFFEFPLRDLQSFTQACIEFLQTLRRRRTLTRRFKEAIKISVCILIAATFQVYVMGSSSTSPVAGVDIIALVYQRTDSESYQYATNRLMGTVLGSLTGLISVQIADGTRWILYLCAAVLTFIGTYVQASPHFFPLGNAVSNSVISIVIQYQNPNGAMTRIQQNCFAILIYFIISSCIWPMRGRKKMKLCLDMSFRMLRESAFRLLHNLDMPENVEEISSDTLALTKEMIKRIEMQDKYISGASMEPTMDSAKFPEMPWQMLIHTQRKLSVSLLMMRHAYHNFMSSGACAGLSVHWVVLHRMTPYAEELGNLIYAACAIYILALSRVDMVPIAHLTFIRQGMIRCYWKLTQTYIDTVQLEVGGQEDSRINDTFSSSDDGGADGRSSPVAEGIRAAVPGPLAATGQPTPPREGDGSPAATNAPPPTAANTSAAAPAAAPAEEKPEKKERPPKKKGYMAYRLSPEERKALRNFLETSSNSLTLPGLGNALNASFICEAAAYTASPGRNGGGDDGSRGASPSTRRGSSGGHSTMSGTSLASTMRTIASRGRLLATAQPVVVAPSNDLFGMRGASPSRPQPTTVRLDSGAPLPLSNNSFLANTAFLQRSFASVPPSVAAALTQSATPLGVPPTTTTTTAAARREGHPPNQNETLSDRTEGSHERPATTNTNNINDTFMIPGEDGSILGAGLATEDSAPGQLPTVLAYRPEPTTGGGLSEPTPGLGSNTPTLSTPSRQPTTPPSHHVAAAAAAAGKWETRNRSPSPPLVPVEPPPTRSAPSTSEWTAPLAKDRNKNNKAGVNAIHRFMGTLRKMREANNNTIGSSIAVGGVARRDSSSSSSSNDGHRNRHTTSGHDSGDDDDGERTASAATHSPHGGPPPAMPFLTNASIVGPLAGGITKSPQQMQEAVAKLSTARHNFLESTRWGAGAQGGDVYNHLADALKTNPSLLPPMMGQEKEAAAAAAEEMLDNLSFFNASNEEFILTSRDIHSLEAFLFGLRAVVVGLEELEMHLLEMIHASELAKKL